MEKTTTSDRLKQIMSDRNLKQIDIQKLCEPYCKQYDIRIGRNDLSHWVNGKHVPTQEKISILAMALDVNEAWLMGYDVPMERTRPQLDFEIFKNEPNEINIAPILTVILKRRGLPDAEAKRRAESLARIGSLTPEGMDLIDAALNLAEKK